MEQADERYEGQERRDGYCPVHHIKCQEIEKINKGLETKVPIWIFKILISVIIIAFGGMNAYFFKISTDTLMLVEKHTNFSNKILKAMSLKNREVLMNQKIVMEHLDIPYREIPKYYGNGKD
jgi:hypothetical protein